MKRYAVLAALFLSMWAGTLYALPNAETVETRTFTDPDRVFTVRGETHVVSYTVRTVTVATTVTVTAPATGTPTSSFPPPSPSSDDPIKFPRIAQHLAFSFDNGANSQHFQLNVMRGCAPGNADKSFALNPNQINFVVPGTVAVGSPGCGAAGTDFAVSYGAYDTITSPIISPYPGIGTIRAYDNSPCMGGDEACFTDGTRMQNNLDWSNGVTPLWAAKVRAHFYQQQLSTGDHAGVHGIWGDNFIWYAPYFRGQRSPSGAPPEGTGQQWDDGAIQYVSTLHSLLPGAAIGANGAGVACGFGNTYVGSVTGKECTAAGDTTMFEGIGGYVNVRDPARLDTVVGRVQNWLNTPAEDGQPKRAIINVYGTAGTNNLGHVLNPQDQRLELSTACVAGAYLWVVNGGDWSSTAVPGTALGPNFAIPEMGDSATFSRGWLGVATSSPQKVESGRWKRTFQGGMVYVNAVNAPWSIDGRTVPAWDGLITR